MKQLAAVNGVLCDTPTTSVLEIGDLGWLQGIGVFETMLVRAARVLFLEEHLSRFGGGLAVLGIEPRPEVVERSCAMVLASWPEDQPGRLRLTQTAGDGAARGSVIATLAALEEVPAEVTLGISKHPKVACDPLERIKSTSRVRNFVARRQALADGHYDALVPTTEGDFSEGTASNLFALVSGTIWTPGLERGCLPGVTRDRVIAVMRKLSIPMREDAVSLDLLEQADEVFVTNSSTGVLPVTAIASLCRTFPGSRGLIAKRVRDGYEWEVSRYLVRPLAAPEAR